MLGSEESRSRQPGRSIQRPRLSALILLLLSLLASGASAALLLMRRPVPAGAAAMVAALAMILAAIEARSPGGPVRDRFAELLADRIFDACVLASLAWAYRADAVVSLLALVSLGTGFVASYERAKAAALGYRAREGLEYRAVRNGVIVGGLLSGWIGPSLWVVTGITVVAVAVRAWNLIAQERRARAADESR